MNDRQLVRWLDELNNDDTPHVGDKNAGSTIAICGQAPSDHPAFAGILVQAGIDSMSLNPTAWPRC